jgi:hypothetical protein
MSGGSLNYFYSQLVDHIGDFGDKELDELVSDLADLFQAREWFLSCDTGPGDWEEARDKFKKKWFTKIGRQKRIEKYLADFTEEVRHSLGISEKYCKTCGRWTGREGSRYGDCALEKSHLFHRSDFCANWERRKENEDEPK